MYWIITLSIISVVTIILTIIARKNYWDIEIFCGILAVVSSGFLIILPLTLINREARFNQTIYEYENLKQLVETYREQDYGNMIPISDAIIDINNTIAEHKAHYNSKWTGLWCSEKIANLEPLSFNNKEKITNNDE